ncbi:MAG: hypothetical protein L0H26_07895, partial [Microlunatus sp.]|nr:hypothetical protein [Microlunatus sp.]
MTTSTVASPTMAPQDLPHDNAQFIAFGPEVRVADPMGGEDPVTLRPQVYVQFWPGIKIKEIKDGGMNGDKNDLVTIHFDPESVGLSKPISAHMDANDPLVNIIRERFAAGEPVTAAIEVVRKKSNSATKAPIDLHIPIHALRGAEHPDGAGDGRAMVGPSGDNCRKIVSLINGRTSKTIVSDPREWKHLVSNKTGNIPPEGWRYYAPGDDWKQVGAIIAKATAAAPAGPSPRDTTQSAPPATQASGEQVSAESLRAVVQVAVQDALAQSDQERGEAYGGRSSVRGRFDEGKKWDARTNDGRVNLGSYLVGNTGWAFRWAFTHLTSLLEGETPEDATVWALTERLLDMSDAVQAEAYGRGVEPDRTAASHTVATQWVEWVVEHHDLPYPHLGDEMAIEVWSKSVATQAAAVLAGAGANVGAYLSSKSKAAKDRARTAPAEPPQPTGPSPKLVRGLLDTLGRSWDNREVIGTLGRQVQERNMGPVEVGITDSESAAPSFSYPPADGATTAALDTVLRTRYQALARAEGAVHPVSPTSPASPVPTQASAASPTTPAPPQAAEPTSGYTPQIA